LNTENFGTTMVVSKTCSNTPKLRLAMCVCSVIIRSVIIRSVIMRSVIIRSVIMRSVIVGQAIDTSKCR